MTFANNACPCCGGTGLRQDRPKVGFRLQVGDIVQDHCGLLVRVDEVWDQDETTGWGTTLNAPDSWVLGPNHANHRIETDNEHYTTSLWKIVSRERVACGA